MLTTKNCKERKPVTMQINGLQIGDIEKKALYLALGKESQKCVGHKYPGKKPDTNFAEFRELLKTTFTITTNLTHGR